MMLPSLLPHYLGVRSTLPGWNRPHYPGGTEAVFEPITAFFPHYLGSDLLRKSLFHRKECMYLDSSNALRAEMETRNG